MSRRTAGVTLIELMCCLAVIAVLSACAVPLHREAMQRVRRADARSALLAMQGLQERYFFVHGRYAAALAELGDAATLSRSDAGFYRVELQSSAEGAGFVAIASPRPDGPQARDACRRFRVDDRGRRDADGDVDGSRRCWG